MRGPRSHLASCYPGVHDLQAVDPAASWNEPATQFVHVSAPAVGLTVPGAHGVAVAEPTLHDVPSGQVTHWSTELITLSDAFLCVPPGHGCGALDPSTHR